MGVNTNQSITYIGSTTTFDNWAGTGLTFQPFSSYLVPSDKAATLLAQTSLFSLGNVPQVNPFRTPVYTIATMPTAAAFGEGYLTVTGLGLCHSDGVSTILPVSPAHQVAQKYSGVSIIAVAATFTTISVANNGGNVQLSSAGVHGLTTTPAAGANIYVSAGTGWTAGLYTILTIDSTTAFTISLAYSAAYGAPTVSSVNTDIPVFSIPCTAGIMGPNGIIQINTTHVFTSSANAKKAKWFISASATPGSGSLMCNVQATTSTSITSDITISNQNSQASQACVNSSNGDGTGGTIYTSLTDTSAPFYLGYAGNFVAANEIIQVLRYSIISTYGL